MLAGFARLWFKKRPIGGKERGREEMWHGDHSQSFLLWVSKLIGAQAATSQPSATTLDEPSLKKCQWHHWALRWPISHLKPGILPSVFKQRILCWKKCIFQEEKDMLLMEAYWGKCIQTWALTPPPPCHQLPHMEKQRHTSSAALNTSLDSNKVLQVRKVQKRRKNTVVPSSENDSWWQRQLRYY